MSRIGKFWASVSSVLTGMVVAQSIPILSSLVITRIFAPSQFGLFAAWLGIVMFFSVMVTGRFEIALVVEKDGLPRQFAALSTVATIVLSCFMLGIVVAGLFVYKPAFLEFSDSLYFLFVPAVLFFALSVTWQSWAAAEGYYRLLSAIRIIQALGIALSQVLLGICYPSVVSLAIGQVLGCLIGVMFAVYKLPLNYKLLHPIDKFVFDLKRFWSRNRRFPMLSLPADSINSASAQLPLLIINSQFGAETGGVFALTMRVMGAPIGLLGAAVRDVFKRTAAESYRNTGSCRIEYVRTFKVLLCCSIVFSVGVVFLAEPIFVVAFGEAWRNAGVIAVWLIPMFALRFVASPLSYTMYIAEKQHIDLIWQVCLLAMTVGCLYSQTDYKDALILYSCGYSVLYVAYLFLSYRFSRSLV